MEFEIGKQSKAKMKMPEQAQQSAQQCVPSASLKLWENNVFQFSESKFVFSPRSLQSFSAKRGGFVFVFLKLKFVSHALSSCEE